MILNSKLAILMFLFSISVYSQDYYWYKGSKIELEIDSSKINVTTATETNLQGLLFEFASNSKVKELERSNNTSLFSVELASTKSYNNIIDNLKSNKDVICISPYYKRGYNNSIGTSSYFYIKLRKKDDYKLLTEFASKNNLEIIKQIAYTPNWYIILNRNSEINSTQASNMAYESGLFANVDPAFMFNFGHNCTNDSLFNRLWGLKNNTNPNVDIKVCDAWTITRGEGINVAVSDEGVVSHRDLDSNIHPTLSYDSYTETSPSQRYGQHGTHVAGTIAAVKDNGKDIVGVAPKSKIIPISHNLIISQPTKFTTQLVSDINWAWKNGADVINCSWGDQGHDDFYGHLYHSTALEEALDSALTFGRNSKGCVVVFAAGNYGHLGKDVIDYPANYHKDILAVGMIDSNGIRHPRSAYGNELDVVAPGVNILSTVPSDKGYLFAMTGTSYAAPHISGVSALILSVDTNLTNKQVKFIIECTAQKIRTDIYDYNYNNPERTNCGWNEEVGYGLVDAYAAVQRAKNFWYYNFYYINLWIASTSSYHTLYMKSTCCSGGFAGAFKSVDTITFKDKNGVEKCIKGTDSNRIYFPSNLTELDSVEWYINGYPVQTGTSQDINGYYFDLFEYEYLWNTTTYTDDYIIVELEIPPDSTRITFKFKIANCDDEDECDGIDITRELGQMHCCVPYRSYHEFFNITSEKKIIGIEVDSFPFIHSADSSFFFMPEATVTVDSLGDNYGRIEVAVGKCVQFIPYCSTSVTRYFDLNYCILFEDSTKCCKTERIIFICPCTEAVLMSASVVPNPLMGPAVVNYRLSQIPNSQMRITIHNTFGTELMSVYEGIPVSVIGSEPFNISSLPNGAYIVKIVIENEILEIPISINIIKN